MGTFEGLGVPRFGAYKRYTGAQTEILDVTDSGTYNHAVTLATGDDVVKIAMTCDTAAASGYFNGLLVTATNSAALTGSSEMNGIWCDMTVSANCSNAATGIGSYIAGGHASAQIFGARFAVAPSTTCTSHIGVSIEKYNTTEATGNDWFLRLMNQGSARTNSAIWIGGTYYPDFLFEFQADTAKGCLTKTTLGHATNSVGSLLIKAGATDYCVALYATT